MNKILNNVTMCKLRRNLKQDQEDTQNSGKTTKFEKTLNTLEAVIYVNDLE